MVATCFIQIHNPPETLRRGCVRVFETPQENPVIYFRSQDNEFFPFYLRNRKDAVELIATIFKERTEKFEGTFTLFCSNDFLLRVHGVGNSEAARKIDAEIRGKAFSPILEAFFKEIHPVSWIGFSRDYLLQGDLNLNLAHALQNRLEHCNIVTGTEAEAEIRAVHNTHHLCKQNQLKR